MFCCTFWCITLFCNMSTIVQDRLITQGCGVRHQETKLFWDFLLPHRKSQVPRMKLYGSSIQMDSPLWVVFTIPSNTIQASLWYKHLLLSRIPARRLVYSSWKSCHSHVTCILWYPFFDIPPVSSGLLFGYLSCPMLQILLSAIFPTQPSIAPLSSSSGLDAEILHQFPLSPKPLPTRTLPEGMASWLLPCFYYHLVPSLKVCVAFCSPYFPSSHFRRVMVRQIRILFCLNWASNHAVFSHFFVGILFPHSSTPNTAPVLGIVAVWTQAILLGTVVCQCCNHSPSRGLLLVSDPHTLEASSLITSILFFSPGGWETYDLWLLQLLFVSLARTT